MQGVTRKETIIYEGTFNPPTLEQQAILQACIDYAELRNADVWLVPSGSRVHKQINESRDDRLVFCRALIRDINPRTVQISINTIEIDSAQLADTFDAVQELALLYPDRAFTWASDIESVSSAYSFDAADNSSVVLRRRIINDEPFDDLVGSEVLQVIVRNGGMV